jgi:hypothetical protein
VNVQTGQGFEFIVGLNFLRVKICHVTKLCSTER